MSELLERLVAILERENGVKKPVTPVVEEPTEPRYQLGTVFVTPRASINGSHRVGILTRTSLMKCAVMYLPEGTITSGLLTWSDPGVTVKEFHDVFGQGWVVSRRGKEALEEWARSEV